MAFDLAIFNKQTYTALTETVSQAIDKFNEASAGTIILQNAQRRAISISLPASS